MGRQRPKHTLFEERLAVVMSANALFQLALDVIFEALHLVPTRVNHLSLTVLNAFISYKTLSAIRKNRFSFMHEDCQILWLMEICLIVGDVYYSAYDNFGLFFIYVRLIFIICSVFNFLAVSYIMLKYQLWSISYKGHGKPSARQNVMLAFRAMSKSMGSLRSMDSRHSIPMVDPVLMEDGTSNTGSPRKKTKARMNSLSSHIEDDNDDVDDGHFDGENEHYEADDIDMDKEYTGDSTSNQQEQQQQLSRKFNLRRQFSIRSHISSNSETASVQLEKAFSPVALDNIQLNQSSFDEENSAIDT